ncbi:hypothetical protein B0H35_001438 [Clostridium acetobutylicum]|nr:hypothetical protein [Clostridium acetobutylicum]NYC92709.1 hypothetical protein [Clostridium acetobutylicum]
MIVSGTFKYFIKISICICMCCGKFDAINLDMIKINIEIGIESHLEFFILNS